MKVIFHVHSYTFDVVNTQLHLTVSSSNCSSISLINSSLFGCLLMSLISSASLISCVRFLIVVPRWIGCEYVDWFVINYNEFMSLDIVLYKFVCRSTILICTFLDLAGLKVRVSNNAILWTRYSPIKDCILIEFIVWNLWKILPTSITNYLIVICVVTSLSFSHDMVSIVHVYRRPRRVLRP